MNSLNYLRSILRTLKPEEINALQKFILYTDAADRQHSKSAKLVEVLLDSENYSSTDIQRTIYGKLNYAAFNKLVNRLKEKTLEVILFNTSLKKGQYSERSRTLFELRKKMIQIDLLILKGVRNKILDEMNIIIRKADTLEIYDVLVQMLYTKQRFLAFDVSNRTGEKIKTDVIIAENKWQALNRSKYLFNDLAAKISASSSPNSYISELISTLKQLEEYFETIDSPTIGYYYFLLKVEHCQIKGDYKQANNFLEKLSVLIEKHKSVYSDFRMGSVTMNKANNFILLKNNNSSIRCIEQAREYFKNQFINQAVLSEIEFYARYYKGDIHETERIISTLFEYSKKANSPLILSKIIYYAACIDFVKGDFSNALNRFFECGEIDKDKEGWNIIKRIMIALCRIESGDFESADLNLANLDKFIKRVIKTKFISQRYLIIIRILRKLINENYNYSSVYQSRKKYFDLLESGDPEYAWKVKSPELIVFEEWFRFKLKKKTYDHRFVINKLFEKSST